MSLARNANGVAGQHGRSAQREESEDSKGKPEEPRGRVARWHEDCARGRCCQGLSFAAIATPSAEEAEQTRTTGPEVRASCWNATT